MNKYKSDFLNFANSSLMKLILYWVPLINLFFSNFIILVIFSNFFDMSQKIGFISYFWFFFIVSIIVSLILVKTNYVLRKKRKKIIKQNKNFGKQANKFRLGLRDSIIIIVKVFFFNILNDFFILLIINLTLISIFWYFDWILFNSQFNIFIELLSLIGIIFGLYHFYIKNYKENISNNINNSLGNYVVSYLKNISFADFLKVLERNKEDVKSIRAKLYEEKNLGKPSKGSFRHKVYLVEIPSYFDLSGFLHLEDFINFKKEDNSLNQEILNDKYKKYFRIKLKQFKKKLNEEDLEDVRKIVLSGIIFFEEIITNLNKLNLQDPKKEENNDQEKSFIDFYGDFQQDCLNYLLNIILNEQNKEIERTKN